MSTKAFLAAVCLALAFCGLSAPAMSQGGSAKSARALQLDADPSIGSADPLAPLDTTGPAPAAPGAPTAAPDAAADQNADPIVLQVRERLSASVPRGKGGEREDYDGLVAYYARAGQPVWTSKDGLTSRASAAIEEIRKADDWGLKASAFELPTIGASPTTEALAEAEIKLGTAVLKYARYARGGRADPSSISRMIDQKPVIYDPASVLAALAAANAVDAYLRDLHPKHPQFERLRQALLAARGGRHEEAAPAGPRIPEGPAIKPGQEHAHVALLRERLSVPAGEAKETLHDAALVDAVKAYQAKHGLAASGTVNNATRATLNGTEARPSSSSENIQRLLVNMERWRWMPDKLGDIYVWDSVPDQMTSVVRDGKVVLSEKIVVGKVTSPTPVFSADMQFIIFHPSWGVPPGMKANELWPQLRETGGWLFGTSASSVLRGHGLQVSYAGRPVDPELGELVERRHPQLRVRAAARPDQCARHGQVPLPQQARRLHARHAGAAPVRRRHARLQPRLHAGAEPGEAGRGTSGRRQGLGAGESGRVRAARWRDQARQADPGARHLLHRRGR